MTRVRFVVSFLPALFAATPALAQQTPQVAHRAIVLDFSGPQSDRARAALVANLEDSGWTVVTDDELHGAQQSAGLHHVHDAQDYAAVAAATHASTVLTGSTAHHRRTWSVTVTVYSGSDGGRLGSATWSGDTAESLTEPRGSGVDRLGGYLTSAQPQAHANPQEAAGGSDAIDNERPPGNDDEERPGQDDERPRDDEQAPAAAADDDDDRWDGFVVDGLVGAIHRDMSATVFPARLARTMESEVRTYQSAAPGSLELGVGAEVYPGALLHGQPFPYLGIVAHYRHSVGLSSNGCGPATAADGCPQVQLPTDEQELYLGLRARFVVFGKARTGMQLDFDAGYDLFAFTFNTAALQRLDPSGVVPPISYSNLHFGAGVSYPVVPTYLRLGLRAAFRLGLSVGTDARRIWGETSGAGDSAMLTVFARTEAPYIVKGLFFGLDLDWFAYYTKYNGEAACIAPGGCTTPTGPWEQVHIPHGVTDSYVRVTASVGYAFR